MARSRKPSAKPAAAAAAGAFAEEDAAEPSEHTRGSLNRTRVAELREVCETLGLDETGKKDVLVARILHRQATAAAAAAAAPSAAGYVKPEPTGGGGKKKAKPAARKRKASEADAQLDTAREAKRKAGAAALGRTTGRKATDHTASKYDKATIYRIELAKSGRGACKATGTLIGQGQPRFAVWKGGVQVGAE